MLSPIHWIEPDEPLPLAQSALTEPNGLVAAGNDLSPQRVLEAYRLGIFPWFSPGQPVLWWSPDPRMILETEHIFISDSLAKKLRQIKRISSWEITTDTVFEQVMRQCAAPRVAQDGTWISERMIDTYQQLHTQGFAHSVEVWNEGQLIGGLYGLCIGRMFYGESMFSRVTDASKVALACLTQKLLEAGCPMIDCQQNTAHLASMGGQEIDRKRFIAKVTELTRQPQLAWSGGALTLADPAVLRSKRTAP
jgi:leucyl/phenylalanyl-tRNA---protein transferase